MLKKIYKFFLFFFLILNFTQAKTDSLFDQGKEVFLNQGTCATCHTLADAQSDGMIGPNLNEIRPIKDQVLSSVTRGIGVMPAFEGILSQEEIEAVSHYVSIAVNY